MAGPDPSGELGSATAIERLARPFTIFAQHKAAGAGVLLVAAVVALVWANSPWGEAYRELLQSRVTVGAGPLELSKPLLLWINDALMGLFFFVVGLVGSACQHHDYLAPDRDQEGRGGVARCVADGGLAVARRSVDRLERCGGGHGAAQAAPRV